MNDHSSEHVMGVVVGVASSAHESRIHCGKGKWILGTTWRGKSGTIQKAKRPDVSAEVGYEQSSTGMYEAYVDFAILQRLGQAVVSVCARIYSDILRSKPEFPSF